MQYNSLEVASYIATLCDEFKLYYNNTKIQKLLYCCYGVCLVVKEERLCDEYPRAWQYGPVFPKVFKHIYKRKKMPQCDALNDAPNDVKELIKAVVKEFGKYSASALSKWTHKECSPWDRVVNQEEAGLHGFIPDEYIKEYFEKNVVGQGNLS